MNVRRCFRVLRLSILPLLIATALPACRGTAPSSKGYPALPTVAKVDLIRYAGTWHEVSRLPNRFQKTCLRSTAEYTPLPDGTVQVRNTCYKAKGRTSGITGTATAVEGSGNAKLKVKFGGFAALAPVPEDGNYWILALDPQYRWAMVGSFSGCWPANRRCPSRFTASSSKRRRTWASIPASSCRRTPRLPAWSSCASPNRLRLHSG